MKMLSKNFEKQEFDCKGNGCCDKTQIPNQLLIDGIQQLRDMCGRPLHINSGIRCAKHNKAVGGSENSFHVSGDAADVSVPKDLSPDQFASMAKKIPQFKNGGIGIYKSWIHVDVRGFKARWRG
jgi:uncharacterized protein YcbK (DUF882 family)